MTRPAPVLGASIDGYAVEGGYDTVDGPATTFGVAQALGRIRASVRSAGTYDHLEDLVELASELGLREVRLTTEWARLEPRHDERDDAALDRYARVLEAVATHNMSSAVVLCDAALPSWVGAEPWLSSWGPRRFAAHAAWVARRLAGLAGTFVTFRAPNATSIDGWRDAARPPFRSRAGDDAASALDGMLLAHQLAVDLVADAAPAARRALLFEARADYDDDGRWRDVAAGVDDPVLLDARRDEWRRAVGGAGLRARWSRREHRAPTRSSARWRDTAPFEWWLGSADATILAAALDHAGGAVTTVELGAGDRGWESQLAVGLPRLTTADHRPATVHLHGLVSSTGPLPAPVGLLAVDQHDGAWSAADPHGRVAQQVRAAGR